MKTKLRFVKSLLVMAALCLGSNAWGQSTTTVTYEFSSFVSSGGNTTLASSGVQVAKNNNTSIYCPSAFVDVLCDRFAMQFRAEAQWSIRNTDSDKGLCFYSSSKDDYFSILDLKEGDKVTVNVTSGKLYFTSANCTGTYITSASSYADEATGTPGTWDMLKSGEKYTVNADGAIHMQAKKTWTVISSIVIETSTSETISSPAISSLTDGDERTVTIIPGTSNLKASVATYYTTDGTEPTTLSTKYTGPFNVSESKTIKAISISNSSAETASAVAEQYIDMDVVDIPTASMTAVDGITRTITFACTTDGVTFSYATQNADESWTEFTTANSVVISENTTLKVKATKGLKETTSEAMSFLAGTEVQLNAPTYTIGVYSAGNYTITLSTDQSSVLLTPTAKITYTIDGGAETDVVSGTGISVAVGSTLTMWSTADGYSKSSDVIVTPTYIDFSTYRVEWTSDFKTLAGSIIGTGSENYNKSTSVTLSAEELVAGYYNITNEGFNSKFGVNNVNWQVRYYGSTKEFNTGLWPYNVNGSMVITDLSAGDVIVFTGDAVTAGTNVTKDVFSSTANSNHTFVVSADGNATFTPTKSGYIYSVTVYTQRPAAVSKTISTAGWATYCSPYALDFTGAIANLTKAYMVTGNSGSTLTLTPITTTIPANTGILLEGSGEVAIPVVASSDTNVDANKLVGTVASTMLTAKQGYVLMGSPAVGFYKNNKDFTLGANTAYLPVDFAGARSFDFFNLEAETTGINAIENAKQSTEGIYNLAGQRVAQPTRGLYIVNGKKIVVK